MRRRKGSPPAAHALARPCNPSPRRTPTRTWACAVLAALGPCFLAPATALAQGPGARLAGVAAVRPQSAPAPADGTPLRVLARPDVAVGHGGFSAGTGGKFLVSQEIRMAHGLRSTLSASLAVDSPGDANRFAGRALRQGLARWALDDGRGHRGHLAVWGDPSSTTVQARVETSLPGSMAFSGFSEMRWNGSSERVHTGSMELRRQVAGTLVVQPGLFVNDVRGPSTFHWTGTSLRVEWRGTELAARYEGPRGSRWSGRKTWVANALRITVGGESEHRPFLADRSLVELGVGRGALGVRYFEGRTRRAGVLRIGPVQIGQSVRPGQRQTVLGFGNASLSLTRSAQGATQVGVGFVFRGVLRSAARSSHGWQCQPPLGPAALDQPHLRWPGFASVLD